MTIPDFTLDEEGLRAYLATLEEGYLPIVWAESPASALDSLYAELGGYVQHRWGYEILPYPLRHDYDSDMILVVVRRGLSEAGLAGTPGDWDDYFGFHNLDTELTVDETVEVLKALVVEANRIVGAA